MQVRAIRTCAIHLGGNHGYDTGILSMSALNRDTLSASDRPRFIAPENVETAKKQAYMLRDLLAAHCGVHLKGGDVTDAFSLLYHNMDWATLMANVRGTAADRYYGAQPRDIVHQQARDLKRLVGSTLRPVALVLMEMPKESYTYTRTMAGARLATLISGNPSWRLWAWEQKCFDARDGSEIQVIEFSSDPETNDELVRSRCLLSGETRFVPVEQVLYCDPADLDRFSSVGTVDVRNLASEDIAKHWISHGNSVLVETGTGVTASGTPVSSPDELGRAMVLGAKEGVRLRLQGLEEVRDPIERFGSSFLKLKALLPQVKEADNAFYRTLESCHGTQAEQLALLETATFKYNQVLDRAAKAYWLDTQEINSWSTIREAFVSTEPYKRLSFSNAGPYQTLISLIVQNQRADSAL